MGRRAKIDSETQPRKRRPGLTPEARENQLISMAMDLAEQRIRDGTASSQLLTYVMKQGSTTNRLEKEKLETENMLLRAKIEALQAERSTEERYIEAINAMRKYAGAAFGDDDTEE